ncbi:MAG: MarR family winged helix-turn-helix transcriptional regulator [Mycobacteriales bacterium]
MPSNSEAAEQLRFLVLAAQREGQRIFAAALRPLGVTPTQAEALRVLADHEPLLLRELGALLVSETGSPSRLVSAMVQLGWVERSAAADRRAVELRLSHDGHRVADAVTQAEHALYEQINTGIRGRDLAATMDLLSAFIAGRPTDLALKRRRARQLAQGT